MSTVFVVRCTRKTRSVSSLCWGTANRSKSGQVPGRKQHIRRAERRAEGNRREGREVSHFDGGEVHKKGLVETVFLYCAKLEQSIGNE